MIVSEQLNTNTRSRINLLYAALTSADGEFVRSEVASSPPLAITCVTNADEALKRLEALDQFDAVLVDMALADSASLITRIRQRYPALCIVTCSTDNAETQAGGAVNADADGWIPKRRDDLARLHPLVRRVLDEQSAARAAAERAAERAPEPVVEPPAPVTGQAESERQVAELNARHEAERREAEERERAAAERHRAECDQLKTALAARETELAQVAQESMERMEANESERARLEEALASRERELARLAEDLTGLRAQLDAAQREAKKQAQPQVRESDVPQRQDRPQPNARSNAGRLISAVVDDVDTMLRGIAHQIEQLSARLPPGEWPIAGVRQAMRQGHALTHMLRAFARREMQRGRLISLNDLVQRLRPTLAGLLDEDVQLAVELAPGLEPIAIDPLQMELALVGVIVAVKAQLPTGGHVTIATGRTASSGISADTTLLKGRPNYVRLEVTAVSWREEIAVAELASDTWCSPAEFSKALNLSAVEKVLSATGAWLDVDIRSPHRVVIAIGIPDAKREDSATSGLAGSRLIPGVTKLLVATTNRDKLREIRTIFEGQPALEILTLADYPGLEPPEETGRTFEENARLKALHYARATGQLTVAEDSGLEIDALDGAPGVESERYNGRESTYPEKFARLYAALERKGSKQSRARFVCTLALVRDSAVLFETRGVVEGTIAPEPRGTGGFGYDPIFYYPPFGQTLAEAGARKSAISHRSVAFRALREYLTRTLPRSL